MNTIQKQKIFGFASLAILLAAGSVIFFHEQPSQTKRTPASSDPSCNYQYFDRASLLAKSQSGSITSITDILKSAPDCFKQNQVAIYDSASLHCANFKAPRMILYANDDDLGRTVCAFNSGVKSDYPEFYQRNANVDCHENAMECETFNVANNRFEFYEVTEKNLNGQKSIGISDTNPTQCLSCHKGTDDYLGAKSPRPNIENYPAWPGFYGSMHDEFNQTPKELDAYLHQFLVYKPNNARYSLLPTIVDANGSLSIHTPVAELQNRLSTQNQQYIGAEFTEQSTLGRIWPFRYAVLAALACDDDISFRDITNTPQPATRNFGITTFFPDPLNASAET